MAATIARSFDIRHLAFLPALSPASLVCHACEIALLHRPD
jgi:hypothetical protein